MRISDWSSDVCSSDLIFPRHTIYAPSLGLLGITRRHADRQRVRDWAGEVTAGTKRLIVIIAERCGAHRRKARRTGRDLNNTRRCVAAEQRALRSFQDRDLFDIEQITEAFTLIGDQNTA